MNKLLLIILLTGVIGSQMSIAEWVVRDAEIMGTTIHTEVWHEDKKIAENAADVVFQIMEEVNQGMSPYIETSELSLLNRKAAAGAIAVSDELFSIIQRSLYYSEITSGAFDITYASVGYLYNYRKSVRPTVPQVTEQLAGVDYRHIIVSENNRSIHFKHADVRIDLGGIAKGFAVDKAIEATIALGIDNILVSAGGDTRIVGDRQGRPWVIGVRHPMDKQRIIAKIPLINEALSTSGDYERYFDEDGVRYHHIIDPKTGDSARSVRAVTILGPLAIDTDALSTSVFVLGPEKGLELVESLPEIEAIIVNQQGNLLYSSGLQNIE